MSIELPDGRLLSDEVLEALRLRAVRGRQLGFSEADLANLLGVSRETICRWWSAYGQGGLPALPQQRTGRPQGAGRALTDEQAQHIQNLLDEHHPEDFHIAAALWTRNAVAELIQQQCGISLAERTVGEYLRRWGYTCQRPARQARKQNPEEVQRWLEETYPAVAEQAAAEGAVIYWCDEMGLGIDEYHGRGYARLGQTPRQRVSGTHQRVSCISAINPDGEGHFMTFRGTLDGMVFITFLDRLIDQVDQKIYLIADHLPAHESAEVEGWLTSQGERIEVIGLPRYAPERNPVEYLNQDAKLEANASGLPRDEEELQEHLDSFLDKIASWPERIMNYFRHPAVQYAAGVTP